MPRQAVEIRRKPTNVRRRGCASRNKPRLPAAHTVWRILGLPVRWKDANVKPQHAKFGCPVVMSVHSEARRVAVRALPKVLRAGRLYTFECLAFPCCRTHGDHISQGYALKAVETQELLQCGPLKTCMCMQQLDSRGAEKDSGRQHHQTWGARHCQLNAQTVGSWPSFCCCMSASTPGGIPTKSATAPAAKLMDNAGCERRGTRRALITGGRA